MNTPPKNDTGRILGAILSGCISVIAAAIVFFPVMYVIFSIFLDLNFWGPRSFDPVNNIVIMISCLVWLFISMYCGGYVASRIALEREYHIGWTVIIISIIVYVVYAHNQFRPTNFPTILVLLFFGIIGTLAGCHSAIQYKQRKKKEARIHEKQREQR